MWKLLFFLLGLLYRGIESQFIADLSWKQMDFDFPNEAAKSNWIQNNTFPMDADFTEKDPKRRIFVTTPKFLKGVPASLSSLRGENLIKNPPLEPYPSWDAHSDSDCNKITSVMRIKMTDCGNIWVLDTGVYDVLETFEVKCPPKLLVYDLKTNKEIWRYEIPAKDLQMGTSLLATVDVNGKCGKEHAYLADITGYGIVVVDRVRSISWRVENNLMRFDPDWTQYNIDGQKFELQDGPVSVTSNSKFLYFHSLSGNIEHWVPLDVINNEKNFINNKGFTDGFQTAIAKRNGQSGPAALARNGRVLIFNNVRQGALYCWKTNRNFVAKNLHKIYQNKEMLKFTTGLKVVKTMNAELVVAVTSPFGNIMNGNIDINKVNYRIMKARVKDLLKSTKCAEW